MNVYAGDAVILATTVRFNGQPLDDGDATVVIEVRDSDLAVVVAETPMIWDASRWEYLWDAPVTAGRYVIKTSVNAGSAGRSVKFRPVRVIPVIW